MKRYKLFSSVYPDVNSMLINQFTNYALELNNVSKLYEINSVSFKDALVVYLNSNEFNVFFESKNSTVYLYYLDSKNRPHQIYA